MERGDSQPRQRRENKSGGVVAVALVFGSATVTALHARELFVTWGSSPMDALGWVAFLIWLLPLGLLWHPGDFDLAGLGCGFFCTFAGAIAGLHWLIYLGLAVTLAGLLPFAMEKMAWVISAVGWMPAYAESLGAEGLMWPRVGTVLIGLVVYAWAALLNEEITDLPGVAGTGYSGGPTR